MKTEVRGQKSPQLNTLEGDPVQRGREVGGQNTSTYMMGGCAAMTGMCGRLGIKGLLKRNGMGVCWSSMRGF